MTPLLNSKTASVRLRVELGRLGGVSVEKQVARSRFQVSGAKESLLAKDGGKI
jgi:hypothetical protein